MLRDAPLDFKGGGEQEVFVKKKNLTHSKVKKKKLDPHIEGKKKNLTHMGRKKKTCPTRVKKKNLPTHRRRGKKYTPGTSVIPRGGGRPLSKGRVSF